MSKASSRLRKVDRESESARQSGGMESENSAIIVGWQGVGVPCEHETEYSDDIVSRGLESFHEEWNESSEHLVGQGCPKIQNWGC